MQTLFTIPSAHQPLGGPTNTPGGEFIGGHVRTAAERLEALARIKAKSAAAFAARDKEIQGKKGRQETADQKKAKRLADALLRQHAPKKATQTDPDPLDAPDESVIDIDDIDVDAIDIDGGARGYGYEDEDVDDAGGGGETDADEPAAIDDLINRRESRARADRWGHRPVLGFEGGAPLGVSTADICERGQDRTKSKPEMTRADEAREFQRIRQDYPIDGYDYKVLCHLCDPSLSKKQIADKLGRDPRAIRYAAGRIRKQAASGKYHTRRGAGVDLTDRQEVRGWLAQPLPKAASGRKKKGAIVRTPKKIRIPARLRLAPLVAVVATNAPRPYKPCRPRTRFVDPGQVDMFAFGMAA